MSKPAEPFKLPEAFLTSLREFTNGFHLVVVNSNSDFDTYSWNPNKLTEMAMMNYIDIQSTAMQEIIRQLTVERELPNDDGDEPSV